MYWYSVGYLIFHPNLILKLGILKIHLKLFFLLSLAHPNLNQTFPSPFQVTRLTAWKEATKLHFFWCTNGTHSATNFLSESNLKPHFHDDQKTFRNQFGRKEVTWKCFTVQYSDAAPGSIKLQTKNGRFQRAVLTNKAFCAPDSILFQFEIQKFEIEWKVVSKTMSGMRLDSR